MLYPYTVVYDHGVATYFRMYFFLIKKYIIGTSMLFHNYKRHIADEPERDLT